MYKEKLIELLITDAQVKEQKEKLQFGTIIRDDNNNQYKVIKVLSTAPDEAYGIEFIKDNFTDTKSEIIVFEGEFWEEEFFNKFDIIGLPLQERFITMYCKKFNFIDGDITLEKYRCLSDNNTIALEKRNMDDYSFDLIIEIKIDNTKDFDNQDDEVYQKIYESLLELNK